MVSFVFGNGSRRAGRLELLLMGGVASGFSMLAVVRGVRREVKSRGLGRRNIVGEGGWKGGVEHVFSKPGWE